MDPVDYWKKLAQKEEEMEDLEDYQHNEDGE